MKKLISLLSCLTLLSSSGGLTAFAEEAVPVDVEEAVYQQFLADYFIDENADGIVTAEELAAATSLSLSLDGVSDLSWMRNLQSLTYLSLTGGEFTDLSILLEIPKLRNLYMDSVPIEDISFTKNIALETFRIENMPQITTEDRLNAMRWGDVQIQQGFSAEAGALPGGLLDDVYNHSDIVMTIEDPNIAFFDFSDKNPAPDTQFAVIYGVNPGTTRYVITGNDEELFSGTITVVNSDVPVENPPINGELTETPVIQQAYTYGTYTVQIGDKLYSVCHGKVTLAETNVVSSSYIYNQEQHDDVVLLADGTIKIGGKLMDTGSTCFTAMEKGDFISDNGGLYTIRIINGKYQFEQMANDFVRFGDDGAYNDYYYVNTAGELIFLTWQKNANGSYTYSKFPTGIMNPSSGKNDFFVDENNILWEFNRNKKMVTKKAEDVVYVGYRWYDNGTAYSCVHIKSDGTAYHAGTSTQVELYDKQESSPYYLESGRLYFDDYYSEEQEMNRLPNYHITNDNTLCLYMEGNQFAITNVAAVIGGEYYPEQDELYAYFIRTDGSIWAYGFRSGIYAQLSDKEVSSVPGDLNQDNQISTADVIMLQKWLLKSPDVHLTDGKAADLNSDGIVNVFDLTLLKRLLLQMD